MNDKPNPNTEERAHVADVARILRAARIVERCKHAEFVKVDRVHLHLALDALEAEQAHAAKDSPTPEPFDRRDHKTVDWVASEMARELGGDPAGWLTSASFAVEVARKSYSPTRQDEGVRAALEALRPFAEHYIVWTRCDPAAALHDPYPVSSTIAHKDGSPFEGAIRYLSMGRLRRAHDAYHALATLSRGEAAEPSKFTCECCGERPGTSLMEEDGWLCSSCATQAAEESPNHHHEAGGAPGREEWRGSDQSPTVPAGRDAYFIVAVRRAHNGEVYSFPATYLNAMLLDFEDEAECRATTGWFSATADEEDHQSYHPLLSEGDELVAWCEVPKFSAGNPPSDHEGREQVIGELCEALEGILQHTSTTIGGWEVCRLENFADARAALARARSAANVG